MDYRVSPPRSQPAKAKAKAKASVGHESAAETQRVVLLKSFVIVDAPSGFLSVLSEMWGNMNVER